MMESIFYPCAKSCISIDKNSKRETHRIAD